MKAGKSGGQRWGTVDWGVEGTSKKNSCPCTDYTQAPDAKLRCVVVIHGPGNQAWS
jgi:hypothetical protein